MGEKYFFFSEAFPVQHIGPWLFQIIYRPYMPLKLKRYADLTCMFSRLAAIILKIFGDNSYQEHFTVKSLDQKNVFKQTKIILMI